MRFIPATGREDEESYVTTPIDSIPEFTVTVRPTTNTRWAKIAKKKGLKANENQEYAQLFDMSEESCKESLIDWKGTDHVWPEDAENGGFPVSDVSMRKMATRLCGSVVEVGTNEDGTAKWKSFWMVIQEQMAEQRAIERKN